MTGSGLSASVAGSVPRLRVGYRPPDAVLCGPIERIIPLVDRADALGIDQLVVGDHVSFHDGRGYDGIVHATALAARSTRMGVQIAVYLLPLRPVVPVARQVASLAGLAPGRLVLGVGVGGEDRHEVEICGIDPATRGRRTDSSLAVLRRLLAGEVVTHHDEFVSLDAAQILPTPTEPVPITIGGRSPAAFRRTGRLADGFLGLYLTPDRYRHALGEVLRAAEAAGRSEVVWRHGFQAWCGFGRTKEAAAAAVAPKLEDLYKIEWARFARYVPHGTPADVAEALAPYVEAGAVDVNLIPEGEDLDEAVDAVAEVRRLLIGVR